MPTAVGDDAPRGKVGETRLEFDVVTDRPVAGQRHPDVEHDQVGVGEVLGEPRGRDERSHLDFVAHDVAPRGWVPATWTTVLPLARPVPKRLIASGTSAR